MLEITSILIGSFVGAGFASGKEIFNFFTVYKYNGIISIIIFSLLLFILIYKCINIKSKLNLNKYLDFINYLENKYKYLNSNFFLLIINIFLASSFYIMIAALSSLLDYQLNISKYITVFFTLLICFRIFYKNNIYFIGIINSILMPILIIFIIFISTININFDNIKFIMFENNSNMIKSIFIGLLYFSYNSLLLIPIIFNFKNNYNNNENLNISIIFSLLILFLTIILDLLLLSFYNLIYNIELPILYISNKTSNIFLYLYFFIILSAIFTTMISSGYSFVNNLTKKDYNKKLIIFLLFSFIFCFFSFSNLINFFYPLFGLIGFFQIFLILIDKY